MSPPQHPRDPPLFPDMDDPFLSAPLRTHPQPTASTSSLTSSQLRQPHNNDTNYPAQNPFDAFPSSAFDEWSASLRRKIIHGLEHHHQPLREIAVPVLSRRARESIARAKAEAEERERERIRLEEEEAERERQEQDRLRLEAQALAETERLRLAAIRRRAEIAAAAEAEADRLMREQQRIWAEDQMRSREELEAAGEAPLRLGEGEVESDDSMETESASGEDEDEELDEGEEGEFDEEDEGEEREEGGYYDNDAEEVEYEDEDDGDGEGEYEEDETRSHDSRARFRSRTPSHTPQFSADHPNVPTAYQEEAQYPSQSHAGQAQEAADLPPLEEEQERDEGQYIEIEPFDPEMVLLSAGTNRSNPSNTSIPSQPQSALPPYPEDPNNQGQDHDHDRDEDMGIPPADAEEQDLLQPLDPISQQSLNLLPFDPALISMDNAAGLDQGDILLEEEEVLAGVDETPGMGGIMQTTTSITTITTNATTAFPQIDPSLNLEDIVPLPSASPLALTGDLIPLPVHADSTTPMDIDPMIAAMTAAAAAFAAAPGVVAENLPLFDAGEQYMITEEMAQAAPEEMQYGEGDEVRVVGYPEELAPLEEDGTGVQGGGEEDEDVQMFDGDGDSQAGGSDGGSDIEIQEGYPVEAEGDEEEDDRDPLALTGSPIPEDLDTAYSSQEGYRYPEEGGHRGSSSARSANRPRVNGDHYPQPTGEEEDELEEDGSAGESGSGSESGSGADSDDERSRSSGEEEEEEEEAEEGRDTSRAPVQRRLPFPPSNQNEPIEVLDSSDEEVNEEEEEEEGEEGGAGSSCLGEGDGEEEEEVMEEREPGAYEEGEGDEEDERRSNHSDEEDRMQRRGLHADLRRPEIEAVDETGQLARGEAEVDGERVEGVRPDEVVAMEEDDKDSQHDPEYSADERSEVEDIQYTDDRDVHHHHREEHDTDFSQEYLYERQIDYAPQTAAAIEREIREHTPGDIADPVIYPSDREEYDLDGDVDGDHHLEPGERPPGHEGWEEVDESDLPLPVARPEDDGDIVMDGGLAGDLVSGPADDAILAEEPILADDIASNEDLSDGENRPTVVTEFPEQPPAIQHVEPSIMTRPPRSARSGSAGGDGSDGDRDMESSPAATPAVDGTTTAEAVNVADVDEEEDELMESDGSGSESGSESESGIEADVEQDSQAVESVPVAGDVTLPPALPEPSDIAIDPAPVEPIPLVAAAPVAGLPDEGYVADDELRSKEPSLAPILPSTESHLAPEPAKLTEENVEALPGAVPSPPTGPAIDAISIQAVQDAPIEHLQRAPLTEENVENLPEELLSPPAGSGAANASVQAIQDAPVAHPELAHQPDISPVSGGQDFVPLFGGMDTPTAGSEESVDGDTVANEGSGRDIQPVAEAGAGGQPHFDRNAELVTRTVPTGDVAEDMFDDVAEVNTVTPASAASTDAITEALPSLAPPVDNQDPEVSHAPPADPALRLTPPILHEHHYAEREHEDHAALAQDERRQAEISAFREATNQIQEEPLAPAEADAASDAELGGFGGDDVEMEDVSAESEGSELAEAEVDSHQPRIDEVLPVIARSQASEPEEEEEQEEQEQREDEDIVPDSEAAGSAASREASTPPDQPLQMQVKVPHIEKIATREATPETEEQPEAGPSTPIRPPPVPNTDLFHHPHGSSSTIPRASSYLSTTATESPAARTRSHCVYHKVRFTEPNHSTHIVLIPGCSLGSPSERRERKAEDLGPASLREMRLRQDIDFGRQFLGRMKGREEGTVAREMESNVRLLVGGELLREGHIFFLSGDDVDGERGGEAVEEEEEDVNVKEEDELLARHRRRSSVTPSNRLETPVRTRNSSRSRASVTPETERKRKRGESLTRTPASAPGSARRADLAAVKEEGDDDDAGDEQEEQSTPSKKKIVEGAGGEPTAIAIAASSSSGDGVDTDSEEQGHSPDPDVPEVDTGVGASSAEEAPEKKGFFSWLWGRK